jgi:hypothetical protein
VENLELGLRNAVLVIAFGNKTRRIRVQEMIQIRTDHMVLDHIFLILPKLLTQALLDVDFCRMNNVIINFPEQCFTMERDGKVSRHQFSYANNVRSIGRSDLCPTDESTNTDMASRHVAANPVQTEQRLITPNTIYEREQTVTSMRFDVVTPRIILKGIR